MLELHLLMVVKLRMLMLLLRVWWPQKLRMTVLRRRWVAWRVSRRVSGRWMLGAELVLEHLVVLWKRCGVMHLLLHVWRVLRLVRHRRRMWICTVILTVPGWRWVTLVAWFPAPQPCLCIIILHCLGVWSVC